MKEESNERLKKIEGRLEELEWGKRPHFDRCLGIKQAFNDGVILRAMPSENEVYCLLRGESQYSRIFVITHCPFCGEELKSGK